MMRCFHVVSAWLLIAALPTLFSVPVYANSVELLAAPWTGRVEWSPPEGTIIRYGGARHGHVVLDGSVLSYEPVEGGHFWTIGTDRLWVDVGADEDGGLRTLHRLTVFAGLPGEGVLTDFETDDWPLPVGVVDIGPSGALLGARGATITLDGSGNPVYFPYDIPDLEDPISGAPGTVDAGCSDIRMGVDTPNRDAYSACVGSGVGLGCGAVGVLVGRAENGDAVFRVETGVSPTGNQFRAVVLDAGTIVASTPWVSYAAQEHRVRLDWWTGDEAGLRLIINGRVRGELRRLVMPHIRELQVGVPYSEPGADLEVKVDHIDIRTGVLEQRTDTLTSDVFEQDLSAWEAIGEAAGDVYIGAGDSFIGEAGLEIDIGAGPDDGWGAWVLDRDPQDATMGARFLIDPSDLTIGSNETVSVLLGQITDGATVESRFAIRLWQSPSNGLKIRASARLDGGQKLNLPYASLTGGRQLLELVWRAATEPGSNDGTLYFFINGQLVGELTHLDNDDKLIESLRFGAMYLQEGTSGRLRLDEFESWR